MSFTVEKVDKLNKIVRVFIKYPYITVLIEMAAADEPFAAVCNGREIFERDILFMIRQSHQLSVLCTA